MGGAKMLVGGAMVAALFMPAIAEARDGETRSLRVEYGDLDIDVDPGAEILLNRIERAARRVCGADQGRRPLSEQAATRSCVARAVDQAVSAVDAPRLTALHFGDSAQVVATLDTAD